jgi:hypothetical protein
MSLRPVDSVNVYVDIDDFSYGMVQSRDERKLPKNAYPELYDFILDKNGVLTKRNGKAKANSMDLVYVPHSMYIYREEI